MSIIDHRTHLIKKKKKKNKIPHMTEFISGRSDIVIYTNGKNDGNEYSAVGRMGKTSHIVAIYASSVEVGTVNMSDTKIGDENYLQILAGRIAILIGADNSVVTLY